MRIKSINALIDVPEMCAKHGKILCDYIRPDSGLTDFKCKLFNESLSAVDITDSLVTIERCSACKAATLLV